MAHNDKDMQKLERALTEAHRARQTPRLGTDWALRALRDIRHAAIQEGHRSIGPGIEQLVWRTAAVAATVMLIVTVSMVAWSWTTSNEEVGMLTEEFESASLLFD